MVIHLVDHEIHNAAIYLCPEISNILQQSTVPAEAKKHPKRTFLQEYALAHDRLSFSPPMSCRDATAML